MNLVRTRVIVVVALSIISFTATASVLSGLQHGVEAFTADSTLVISSPDAPTIFSSRIDVGVLSALSSGVSQFTGDFSMSPEVFAFCSFESESFVVRGVNYSLFSSTGPEFEQFEIVNGMSEDERTSAVIGHRLMQRLDRDVPFSMPLVGSYSSRMDLVEVVGWFETGTSMDDELFVSLDRARFLSGTPADKLSIIRVSSDDPDALRDVLTPQAATFTLFGLTSSKSTVAAGEDFTVQVGVRNWGREQGTVAVSFHLGVLDGGTPIGVVNATLNASSSTTVSRHVTLNSLGEQTIRASIAGEFPVTLGINVTAITPYIRYWGPSTIMLDTPFNITVLSYAGSPVPDVEVSLLGTSYLTGDDGIATLVADSLGDHDITGSVPGMTGFTKSVEVLDPLSFPNEFLPGVLGFQLTPDSVRESQAVKGIVQLVNSGTVAGFYDLQVHVDGQLLLYNVSLGPLENRQFTFTLEDLAVGTHSGYIGMQSDVVVVEPWFADEPGFVELLIRYGGSMQITGSASIPVYQAAKISQGNVEIALFSLGAIAALLAGLCITAVFSREVNEARRRLGIAKTLGASRLDVMKLVSGQAFVRGLVGSLVGVIVGLLIANQLSRSGVFMIFGHQLAIELNPWLISVTLVGAVAISLASALVSARIAAQETAMSSIRGLPGDEAPPRENLESISDD